MNGDIVNDKITFIWLDISYQNVLVSRSFHVMKTPFNEVYIHSHWSSSNFSAFAWIWCAWLLQKKNVVMWCMETVHFIILNDFDRHSEKFYKLQIYSCCVFHEFIDCQWLILFCFAYELYFHSVEYLSSNRAKQLIRGLILNSRKVSFPFKTWLKMNFVLLYANWKCNFKNQVIGEIDISNDIVNQK